MKILNTAIPELTDEKAVIEVLIADAPEAETDGDFFLKFRLSIPSAPAPRVAVLQLVALRHARELIDEQTDQIQSLLRKNNVDIPR